MKKRTIGNFLLCFFGIVGIIVLASIGPFTQNEQFHAFSDNRNIFNIPNFWNVISNLPFIIVGILGIYKYCRIQKEKIQYLVLFIGILLTGVGSIYYHLQPGNYTLIWDRLPMTIVFMSMFSIVVSEFVSKRLGEVLFPILLILGVSSVILWILGEPQDLRLYGFVQFYPMLAIPIILIFFKSRFTHSSSYWVLLLTYAIAKSFEYYDIELYGVLKYISGHSLKHIIAGAGLYYILNTYNKRKLIIE